MRLIAIVWLLSLTWTATAQTATRPDARNPCDQYIVSLFDKVTGNKHLAARNPVVISNDRKTGFVIKAFKSRDETLSLNIGLVAAGLECFDAHTPIYVLFRDGSRVTLTSGNSVFECDDGVPLYFGGVFGRDGELIELKSKPIETMRVHTLKSSLQQDFPEPKAKDLMEILKCLDAAKLGPEKPVNNRPKILS